MTSFLIEAYYFKKWLAFNVKRIYSTLMPLKKILIVLPSMDAGGVERIRIILANEFKAFGFEVEYALLNAKGSLLDIASKENKIYDLKVNKIRYLPFKLGKLLKETKPDAILASIWPVTVATVFGVFISRISCSLVLSEHNHLSTQYQHKGFIHKILMRASMFLCYGFASRVVAVSAGVKTDLQRLSYISHKKFEVIYNPILPLKNSDNSKLNEVNSHWNSANEKRIISVGSLKQQKNHSLLINAFAIVNKNLPSKLMIIGEGEERKNLENQVKIMGLENQVIFAGFQQDINPFYQTADLFVLSSNYEGFGNVLLEALINGVNIVSTDCKSGPAEILSNGKYGKLVPVNDVEALASGIIEVLKGSSIDQNILQSRAREFHPSQIAKKYLSLLFPTQKHVKK
tara:strand:+ start:7018 stop:8220 length:1203 start_codon:yes stop_codon:yes gene_type:complete